MAKMLDYTIRYKDVIKGYFRSTQPKFLGKTTL